MAKINCHLLMVVVFVSITGFVKATSRFSIVDYLDVPDINHLGQFQHRYNREAILELQVGPNSKSDLVMEQIFKLARSNNQNAPVFQTLTLLSDESKTECPERLIDTLKSIVAQIYANPESDIAKFHNVLAELAAPKFKSLAPQVDVELSHEQVKNLRDLEALVGAALDVDNNKQDWKSFKDSGIVPLELLQGFSWIEDKMNVIKMIQVAKLDFDESYNVWLGDKRSLTALNYFIERRCLLVQPFKYQLNVLNLATHLVGYEIGQESLKRVNEFRRLCAAYGRPDDLAKIKKNIKEQLDLTPFYVKYGARFLSVNHPEDLKV